MDSLAKPLVMKAVSGAPAARAWLERARRPSVMHVFDRAINLLDPGAGVVSLVPHPLGSGPFAMVLEGTGESFGPEARLGDWVTADSPVRVEARRLAVGRLVVGTAEMKLWDPQLPWDVLRSRRERFLTTFPRLQDLLREEAPPGGLAGLFRGRVNRPPGSGLIDQALLDRAANPARRLAEALATGDVASASDSAVQLAGLGGGLTPSGDDFLIGAMYAVWLADDTAAASRTCQGMVAAAGPRTTHLSRAWLEAGARGEASMTWHRLMAAVIREDDSLSAAARDLLAVGHTSGADALAGFLVTAEALFPNSTHPS